MSIVELNIDEIIEKDIDINKMSKVDVVKYVSERTAYLISSGLKSVFDKTDSILKNND